MFIPKVALFIYLGSMVTRDCTDEGDVEMRIKAGGGAFGALRDRIFAATSISMKVKKLVYVALVLTILLYGSECWSLTEKNFTNVFVLSISAVFVVCAE